MPALLDAFNQGLHADRPAASSTNVGYYYLETDTNGGTLFQSNGSDWIQLAGAVSPPGGGGGGGTWVLSILNATVASLVLTQANCLVIVDPDAGGETVELPTASAHTGEVVIVKGIGAAPFVYVPGGGSGAENQGNFMCAWVSDGSSWRNIWHMN